MVSLSISAEKIVFTLRRAKRFEAKVAYNEENRARRQNKIGVYLAAGRSRINAGAK